MGLFDFFKRDNKKETPPQAKPHNDQFTEISKYKEYVVCFVSMQQQGNYAPIAAYENNDGDIIGFLYINSDESYSLSAGEAVKRMQVRFESRLAAKEIKSYIVFYHSQYQNDDNHAIAVNDDELKAITMIYHFESGNKGKIALPYRFESDHINYGGFSLFSKEENDEIFGAQRENGKDYFQDREEIKAPTGQNAAGIQVTKSNTLDMANAWCGIFGFENYRNGEGRSMLTEHFGFMLSKGYGITRDKVTIANLAYEDVAIKALIYDENPIAAVPVVKSEYAIDVHNKGIIEWENFENMLALVTGTGRDTFGITYLATDYAEHRERYHTERNLNIIISGIVFVLDVSNVHEQEGEVKYSEDFTAYMPSNDLPNYGCFDFIGEVEDYKETSLLENGLLNGYLLKVRLITNPDVTDFFTIDMYVTRENMRFDTIEKGMKVSGMFQMQGRIKA